MNMMNLKFKYLIFLNLFCLVSYSQQNNFKSILQEQHEYYNKYQNFNEQQFDSLNQLNNSFNKTASVNQSTCTLNKKVLGWHPYWNGTTYTNYQWNLLSDLVYFNYEVSPTTGNNTNSSFAWSTASVVTVAKANGTKVHICATLFSGHSTFWASSTAQTTFINNIVSLLNTRQGHGVNIDFEGMGSSDNAPFVTFITNLNNALNAANPSYELSICLYAVDWSNTFNMPALSAQVNYFTIMGYDYYYGGSAQAGPTAPLYNYQTSYNYTLGKSITYYIKQGAPANKLLMGLPYYGREWEVTQNSTLPAATTGSFNASRTLLAISTGSNYTTANKYWEGNCYSPYYKFTTGGSLRQCWVDDVYSMDRKFKMVNQRELGGIAIWALGYDNGLTSYWNLIKDNFSNCELITCNDSIFDMGGPARNYYDNEKYKYTLTVPTGSLAQLQFKSFGTELNYDSLWLYNGASTSTTALIGVYTGTVSPGIKVSTSNSITVRFKSDGATNSFGFKAIKSCVTPTIATNIKESYEINSTVYPNPTSNKIVVKNGYIVSVKDITGKLIYLNKQNENKISFDFTGLNFGMYIIEIFTTKNNIEVKKVFYSN